ncbi:MAG: hypothetical protein Q7S11_00985 [bacterium]|nr:hypothetical protein [bacterium]
MPDSFYWLQTVFTTYPSLSYVIPFFGAALGGEWVIISVAALSAQGAMPIHIVFFASYAGTVTSDFIWFSLGKTKFLSGFITHRYTQTTVNAVAGSLNKISKGSHLSALIVTKFLYGTRIIILLYMSQINLPLKEFMRHNMVATFIWLTVVTVIGFLAGKGLTYLLKIFENITIALGIILLIVLSFFMIQLWFNKRLIGDLKK